MNKKPIFTKILFDFEKVDENNNNVRERFHKYLKAGDDRSKVIFAGMIVENHLDRLLKILFIDYKTLTKRSDYTYSLKISILKSLNLIPINNITMCNCIRKVRNEFAHNFDITTIDDIDDKLKNLIHQSYLENIQTKRDENLIGEFRSIYNIVSGNLRSYEKNVKLLREIIEGSNFEKELELINNERHYEHHEKITKGNPIKITDKGSHYEEKYPQGITVVKKIQKE